MAEDYPVGASATVNQQGQRFAAQGRLLPVPASSQKPSALSPGGGEGRKVRMMMEFNGAPGYGGDRMLSRRPTDRHRATPAQGICDL